MRSALPATFGPDIWINMLKKQQNVADHANLHFVTVRWVFHCVLCVVCVL